MVRKEFGTFGVQGDEPFGANVFWIVDDFVAMQFRNGQNYGILLIGDSVCRGFLDHNVLHCSQKQRALWSFYDHDTIFPETPGF